MKDKKVREELIIDAFAMLFLLAGELYFFRNIIGTGQLISDGSDGRLTMLIAEHWYNVFINYGYGNVLSGKEYAGIF